MAERFLNADGFKTASLSVNLSSKSATITRVYDSFEIDGDVGKCEYPARHDHSHPLNVVRLGSSVGTNGCNATGSTGDWVKKVGGGSGNTTGDLGTARFYARVDHVHPFDTGTGQIRVLSNGAEVSSANYIAPRNFEWERFSDIKVGVEGGSGKGGVQFPILVRIGPSSDGYDVVCVFRTIKIDSNGAISYVGGEYESSIKMVKA